MNRRAFIAGVGSAAACPLVARAQQSGKIPRIGILWAANEQKDADFLGAFRQGLNELGYVEGKNIELLNRFADEHYERFDAIVAEFVEAKVDAILTASTAGTLAAKKATTTIPIVFVIPDPVAQHFVDSLGHPGGNLTGLDPMYTDLVGKHLEILKDCLPGLSTTVLIINPNSPFARVVVDNAQAASRVANIKVSVLEAGKPEDLEQTFSVIAHQKPGAVMIGTDAMLYLERKHIAELAIAYRLPTIGVIDLMAESGLLLSYGPDSTQLFRRASGYVDKILKGANPGDLPVERPTKFNLFINMATARAIGVAIPDSLQLLAEKTFE